MFLQTLLLGEGTLGRLANLTVGNVLE
jgi:hypothetical protein